MAHQSKPRPARPGGLDRRGRATGISNRETAEMEERERREHPAQVPAAPPAEDASGRVGEPPNEESPIQQTSRKAGSRSIAQKADASKYVDRPVPPAQKVAGAFGREPSPHERRLRRRRSA